MLSKIQSLKKTSILHFAIAVTVGFFLLLSHTTPISASYTCTGGGDHGGTTWDPATDCPGGIAGVHTNISTLSIGTGETATVLAYNGTSFGSVSISATTATITGTLTAAGEGYLGSTSSASPGGGSGGGASTSGSGGAGGGGYGGAGGAGSFGGIAGGGTYGSIPSPTDMGSGGGFGNSTNGYSGGGAITLTISGTATVNGTISANGNGGGNGGCGAGGTIKITSGTFTGSGTITANGGNGGTGATQNGNGGGGRIYISYSSSNTFSGSAPTANPGSGGGGGVTGSSLLVDATNNDLYINSSQTWYTSATDQSFTYRNVTVASSITWTQVGYYTNNTNGVGFTFNATNFTLNSSSTISMAGTGYMGSKSSSSSGSGSGGGSSSASTGGGGGGYGGAGGAGSFGGIAGGGTYGSATAPIDLGSGGGYGNGTSGSAGGGAIKIAATGTVTINGTISANGLGTGGSTGGGGSGGSIYIAAGTFTGSTGSLTANGGAGASGSTQSGNGGGGRIAITYSVINTYTGSTPTVSAGNGNGGVGSNGTESITAQGNPVVSSLSQYLYNCSTTVSSGSYLTGSIAMCFAATGSDSLNPDTLTYQIEIEPNSVSFTNTATFQTSSAYSGTPISFSIKTTSLSLGTSYHWQARVIDAEGFASSWTQMGGNPDFIIPSTPTRVGSWATDTDTEFNTGTYSSTTVSGSGASAVVGLTGINNAPSNTQFRRAITIDNTGNGNTLTNYQVSLTLNTASLISTNKLRSDCGDIRFTDSDGVTAINNYWIENCNNASTKIWVKVPSIAASSTKTIYLYYGAPTASSLSSSTNVFLDDIPNLVSAWNMTEGSGTTTADSAGNGNTATFQNSPTWTTGKFGNAISFTSASSQYLSIGTTNLPSGNTNYSLISWFKTSTSGNLGLIGWGNYGTANQANALRTNGSTQMMNYWWSNDLTSTTPTNNDGNWHLAVAQFDGTYRTLYFDNQLRAQDTPSSHNSSTSNAAIGKTNTSGEYFNGTIGNTYVFSSPLTAGQISDLYNNYGYATTNYAKHMLIKQYSAPEPAASVGSESGYSVSSGTWTSVSGASALKLDQNNAWGDGTSNSVAFIATTGGFATTSDTLQFQIRTASSSAALSSASYTTIGTQNVGTTFVERKVDLDNLGISPLPYVQIKATFTASDTSPILDNFTVYFSPTLPSTNATVDSDTDFNKGAYSTTAVSGTGTGATVALSPISPTGDIYSRAITIDNTGNSNTLTNYQVSLTLDTATPISGGKMRSDCGDIRVLDSDQATALNYWVENCNNASTKIWVKVPSISASSTKTIYLYYGNSTDTSLSSVANTFIDDISGVLAAWNLDEASGTSISDATGNGHTGTSTNATIVSGKFGNALSFSNSSTSYASTTNESGFPFGTSARSVCLWAKTPEVNSGFNLAFSMGSGNNEQTFGIGRNGTTLYGFGWNDDVSSSSFWAAGTWEQVCFTFDGSKASLYGNGSQLVAPTAKPSWNTVDSGTTYIGKSEAAGFPDPWDGAVDQVRIYSTVLNTTQVSEIYNNYGYVTSNYSGHELIRKYSSPEPVASVGSENTANSGTWISDSGANVLNLPSNSGWGDGINGTSIGFFMSGTSLNPSQTIKVEMRTASTAGGLSSASYITLGTATNGISLILSKLDMDSLSITAAAYVQIRTTLTQTTGTSPVLDRMVIYYGTTQPPNSPTSLQQYRNDGTTTITNNTWTSDGVTNNLVFKFTMSSPNATDTLTPKIELVTNGSSFSGTPNYSGSPVSYTGTGVTGTVTVTGLTSCTGYKWQAFVSNSVGTSTATVFNATTPNVSVQSTGPTAGSVYDGTSDGVETNTSTSITQMDANWTGFSDACSGLAGTPYTVAIGTTAGGTNISNYTSTGVTLNNPNPYNTYTVSNLPIHTSQTYYVSIKATNNVGLTTVVTSSGQYVTPTLTFSLDSNAVDMGHWNPGNSYSSTATNTLSILTDAYNGYSVYAFEESLLHLANTPSTTLQDFSGGTYAAPGTWGGGLYGFGYTTSCTSINGGNPFASGTKYAPFSHTGPGDIVAQNTTAITGATYTGSADTQTITYKTAAPANQADGYYKTNISYTVVTTL